MSLLTGGAACFGAVVGWLAHAMFFEARAVSVRWLSSMMGVIGGGALTLYGSTELFSAYCVGLAPAFFVRALAFSPVADGLKDVILKAIAKSSRRSAELSGSSSSASRQVRPSADRSTNRHRPAGSWPPCVEAVAWECNRKCGAGIADMGTLRIGTLIAWSWTRCASGNFRRESVPSSWASRSPTTTDAAATIDRDPARPAIVKLDADSVVFPRRTICHVHRPPCLPRNARSDHNDNYVVGTFVTD